MKNNLNGNNLFIKVSVKTNQKKEKIVRKGDRFLIELQAKPQQGKANKRIIAILSLLFDGKRIELVKGFRSKNKIFKIYEKKH